MAFVTGSFYFNGIKAYANILTECVKNYCSFSGKRDIQKVVEGTNVLKNYWS